MKENRISKGKVVIGLTGSFGSGCGVVSDYLVKKYGFRKLSLTKRIKDEAKQRRILHPNRRDMQNIGDKIRQKYKSDFLASEVINEITRSQYKLIVIKSIRNHHEIERLREKFNNFFLFNIDADKQVRYNRCKTEYTSDKDFEDDDERDSGETQLEYGQHVRKCVDNADVVINNDGSLEELYRKINRYWNLINNPGKEKPYQHEINMTSACQQSTQTGCLKRSVGAVITINGQTIASGYNSPPRDEVSCINLKNCYREHAKQCPECSTPFQVILRVCIKCGTSIEKERLAELEKNLDLCRAIHAEERAILQTAKIGGRPLKNAVLYTTTFPCLLCAKKIIEVGISKVFYIEPYPFREAYKILKEAKIKLEKFEGVKSRAFSSFYYRKT